MVKATSGEYQSDRASWSVAATTARQHWQTRFVVAVAAAVVVAAVVAVFAAVVARDSRWRLRLPAVRPTRSLKTSSVCATTTKEQTVAAPGLATKAAAHLRRTAGVADWGSY